MTELSPAATITPDASFSPSNSSDTSASLLMALQALEGSSGPLLMDTEAKIVGVEAGEDLSCDQEGELLIRGPQVTTTSGSK